MQPSAEGKDRLSLLLGIHEELEGLCMQAARNDQGADNFARWDPENAERHKRWERLGLRILRIQSAVDRLRDASRLDTEVLRQLTEQTMALRAVWRGYDQEQEREAEATPPDTEGDRETIITAANIEAANHDAAFAAVLCMLRELLIQGER